MSTRAQLRSNVRSNLADAGVASFFDDDAINDSLQDAYNEVAAKCRCIVKSAQVGQVANQPYYDFLALGVADFLGVTAIFNQATNFWLRDDISIRDFDRLRRDWEVWNGQPQFWAPHSLKYVVVAPSLASTAGELFTLWYWATAPTLTSDSQTPLVSTDMQSLLEHYATADLLENAQEVTKAAGFWKLYYADVWDYKTRCVKLAAADLLLRI